MAGKDSQRGVPRQGSAPPGGETGKGDTSWFACGFADRGQNRKGVVCHMEGNQRVFLFGQRLCRGGPLFASGSSVLPPCIDGIAHLLVFLYLRTNSCRVNMETVFPEKSFSPSGHCLL